MSDCKHNNTRTVDRHERCSDCGATCPDSGDYWTESDDRDRIASLETQLAEARSYLKHIISLNDGREFIHECCQLCQAARRAGEGD